MKTPKVGNTIGALALKNLYDAYADHVLGGVCLLSLPRKKGARQTYKITSELPAKPEYTTLRDATFTRTVEDALSNAEGELESLRDEMTDWRDNMDGTGLENTDKYSEVEEAASELEGIKVPEAPEGMPDIKFVFLPDLSDRTGRAHRASRAAQELRHAAYAVRVTEDPTEIGLSDFADELEDFADELENVSFPGMF